jgi:hypothetical protein
MRFVAGALRPERITCVSGLPNPKPTSLGGEAQAGPARADNTGMPPPDSTPQRDGLASRCHQLLHTLAVIAGWCIFAWSWWLVSDQPGATADLRNLIVGAAVVMPTLTVAWVLHNVGIHRRKGPRRAVAPVPLRYDIDFNGRRIVADWPTLQRARTVVIERGDGVKRFVCEPETAPEASTPRPASPRRAAEPTDFELTES